MNWHHEVIADALDRVAKKELKRLIISMPPRHGKSELISRKAPAFIMGRNPNANIIATSYSAGLASSMNRDVQRVIDSEEYHELFPDTTLNGSIKGVGQGSYIRNSDKFEIVGYEGSYLSSGVGGGITGHGADFAFIDDPVKNRKDAESKVFRDNTFNWFTSTLYTRLEKDACIVITLTRWHEDDLAGRLLRLADENPEADQWEVISLPAIFDENAKDIHPTDKRKHGEALWEKKYDVKRLMTIKSTIGSYEWSALYDQKPTKPGGSIVKRKWLHYYKELPSTFDEMVQSWDFAFDGKEESSYVVGQVWGRKGGDFYLVDQIRDQMDFTESLQAFKNMTHKYPRAKAKYVENKANGSAVMSSLKRKMSGIIPINPKGSKVERLHAVTPYFESGNVYIPHPTIASWVNDFVEELVSFPNSTNDDQVDTTSQALNNIGARRSGGKVGVTTV